MRLTDLEMKRLLPTWMQGDIPDLLLARGVDETMHRVAPDLDLLSLWQALDSLPEAVLDELAWGLDIDWYDSGASYETKVDLVRQSDLVHAHLGTVGAVESVTTSYFGSGRVKEWWEYAGEPHHFKVYSTNPSLVNENLERFLNMLSKVKRLSSKFDGIQIGLTGEGTVHCGIATRICDIETYCLAWPPDPPISIGPSKRTIAKVGVATRTATYQSISIGAKEAA